MFVRRSGPVLVAVLLAAAACKDVSKRNQSRIVIATFSSPNIPTPNDLALQAVPTISSQTEALKELLQSFVDQGGFPADQAPTLSVPLQAYKFEGASGTFVPDSTPAQVDPTTVTAGTAALYKVDVAPPTPIEVEAVVPQTPGSLTLVPKKDATGSRRLPAGRYVFAVRGGDSGVKTIDGLPIGTDLPIALTIPNKDLTNPANWPQGGLTPDQVTQLETIRGLLWNKIAWLAANLGAGNDWIPCVPSLLASAPPELVAACSAASENVQSSAYGAIKAFPLGDLASIAAFQIAAPTGTVPLVDAGSGQAPLPIDLLRTGAGGTIAQNPAFGAAAPGLATLDGFSTTAMILAPTSGPIDASTVNGGNVFLFKLVGNAVSLVPELKAFLGGGSGPPAYVAQPTPIIIPQGAACPIAGGCSVAIGLQPAVPVPPSDPSFFLPPLDENSNYAVVITNRVKDVSGDALVRPTFMQLLLGSNPLAVCLQDSPCTRWASLLPGVLDDATAGAAETMRQQMVPVLSAVGGPDGVVLAYTFKTQSFKQTDLQLAAAPYAIEQVAQQAIFTPSAASTVTPPLSVPGVTFYDVTFDSIDAIDDKTGALRPTLATDLSDPATAATLLAPLHALVAVPDPSLLDDCPGFPAGTKCPRLVIFGHGINGSKETLYPIAGSLAAAQLVAAAIDFPLHGARNWCTQNSDCVVPGTGAAGTCTPIPGGAGQGDTVPPGLCSGGSVPVLGPSHYFLSANFFRMRDAFRQNVLDESALGLALSRPPSPLAPQPSANPFASALLASGIFIDPTEIYYEGLSLGSIAGTSAVASNPRLTRASFSVGGGTFVDIGITSPSFQPVLEPIFTGLLGPSGANVLPPNTPFTFAMTDPSSQSFNLAVAEQYLQTVNVAKWILDPGDPVNYALNLKTAPLPNLLSGGTQPAKAVYGQIAQGDAVVPNPTSDLLYALMSADETLYTGAGASHGMLASEALVQTDAAGFLVNPASPPPTTESLP
ncbi:MAG TPA: hypothetical protein VFG59_01510 [Anaeromyxobacter sp.]|nr:hypothetical protein [Anaeromyxobacter sp.]